MRSFDRVSELVGPSARVARALLFIAVGLMTWSLPTASAEVAKAGAGSIGGNGTVAGDPIDRPGYWTPERMLAARPAEAPAAPEVAFDLDPPLSATGPGAVTSSTEQGDFFPTGIESFPLRVHGKVFFRVDGQDFQCSGTVVDSKGKNVVFTAGHCVFDRETGAYAEQLVFVPAFQEGATPLGIWPASAVFTTTRYVENGDLSHDIGAAVLDDKIQLELGARKIAFRLDPTDRPYTIYGYPADPDPPYDGGALVGCRSTIVGRDSQQGSPAPIAAAPCEMRAGSSGGGWITEGGLLNSVVSYTYCDSEPDLCGFIFGPYFSTQAIDLYTFPAVGGSTAPTVKLVSAPPRRITRNRAKFRFSGSGSTPVSFRCRLDRRAPYRCGKKSTFKRLGKGRHVLRVNSIDQTGRVSPKTVKRTFRVLRGRR